MTSFKQYFEIEMDNDIKNLMANTYGALLNEKEQGITGYYELPWQSKLIIEELQKERPFADFEEIVVIGIGGSSLGTKAVVSFLAHTGNYKPIHFLENPDPVHIKKTFTKIDKEKTLFIVVSKSGTTIETISLFKAALAHFHIDLDKEANRIAVITDIDSNLHKFAQQYGIKSFAIPHNVGGRFSVLSAVGIVPLTLAGYDTEALLLGAANMIERFFAGKEEHILRKSAFIYKNWQTYRMNVLFSYANELEDFNKWYVQLWGESLGKIDLDGNHVGPTPIAHIGSIDQHSFLQLIIEGPRDKTVTFLHIEELDSELTIPRMRLPYLEKTDFVNGATFNRLINEECLATMQSVRESGVPTDSIAMPTMDGESLGELIAYYELLTSSVGAMLGIDTYNQPGVELGKQILKKRFEAQ